MSDEALCRAVSEIRQGLVDADLGSGIIRNELPCLDMANAVVPVPCWPQTETAAHRWIFIYGFEKNERTNVSQNELEALKLLANDLLALTDSQISEAVKKGFILEVAHET